MNLYLLMQSIANDNGDGYSHDCILGIYEDGDVAHQVMHQLIQEHESKEPGCQADLNTSYFVTHTTLIPKVSK